MRFGEKAAAFPDGGSGWIEATSPSSFKVLLVEDNEDDAVLVQEELHELGQLSFGS